MQAVFTDQDLKVESEVGESRGKVSVNLTTVQDHGGGVIVGGDITEGFGGAVCTFKVPYCYLCDSQSWVAVASMDESLPAFDSTMFRNMASSAFAL